MFSLRALSLPLAAGLLAACTVTAPTADITRVAELRSSFGPEYTVTVLPETGIDPQRLRHEQQLPEGVDFEPAECAKLFGGQQVPEEVEGNMSAVSAEGKGNRFIVIAMETSEPMPVVDPGPDCQKVSFAGAVLRGTVSVVDAPEIEDAQTSGVHRVLQTAANGKQQTGQMYSYVAHFGNYQVVVTANPLVLPDKPPAPVDTERAEQLLVAAVAAIRDVPDEAPTESETP